MEDEVATELRRDPRIEIGDISTSGGRLTFMVRDPRQLDAAVERLRATDPAGRHYRQRDWDVQVVEFDADRPDPDRRRDHARDEGRDDVAREVVRRRIDPQGTKEITVINQGANRILVQVPGVEDPEALKELIGQTAGSNSSWSTSTADPAEVAQGQRAAGSQVLPMADGSGFIAVKRRVMVVGDQLTDAKQSFDQDGRPVVTITFNTAGARRFARVTQENVNKPFAIILDDKVLSAPNINEPILGGQAQISGNFTVQSANQLAIALARQAAGEAEGDRGTHGRRRARARIRSTRASIASDRRDRSRVILFMLVTYGRFGVYATLALILNALPDPRHHGGLQRDADSARHRRLRADDRRRGRRQRADQRAHPRGATARPQGCSMRSSPATRKPRRRSSTPTSPTSSRRC